METVTAYCSQCKHRLGSLLNLWTQIGKRYISPVVLTGQALDISPDSVIRQGEIGTIVDNWYGLKLPTVAIEDNILSGARCSHVQNVVCNQCRSVLGSKCLESAVNHVLQEGQLLLRTSSIQIKNLDGHDTIQPTIQRMLYLKNLPTDEVWPKDHESPKLDRLLNEVDAQREEIEHLDTAGYHVVAYFNQAVHRVDEEVGKLKTDIVQMTGDLSDHSTKTKALVDDILSTQAEIKEIQKTLQPLVTQGSSGQESSSIRNAIAEANASWQVEFCNKWGKQQQQLNSLELKLESARQDLNDFQASFDSARTTAKAALLANTEEMVALKAEVQHLRQELALERSYKPSTTNSVFAAREIDILTSNITKIGQRASQVETLQMEFELLKGRVQRMEAQTTTSQKGQAINLQLEDPLHSQLMDSVDCHVADGIGTVTPSTVPNADSGHVSQSFTTHATTSHSSPRMKARRNPSRVGIPKLTKSGAVDKRTLKKKRSAKPTPIARKVKG